MPRRYNLRKRDTSVKWIEDETLKETDSESEDEDYEPPTESEESEEVSLVDEDEEEEEEEEEEEKPQMISIPISKHGRIKIEIDNRPVMSGYETGDEEYDSDDEDDDEDEEEEEIPKSGFLGYLMNKYVPAHRLKKKKKNDGEESPALDLNDDEQEYFDELPKSKQKKLNKHMKQLSALVSEGDVPFKFRVLELPVQDSVKANVIKKLDVLSRMDADGGESHKLRTWVEGFLKVPFGVQVPLPVKLDDGGLPCGYSQDSGRCSLRDAVCQDTDYADTGAVDF